MSSANAGRCWWTRSGPERSVVPALHGKESFDYFAEQPELAELFNRTMASVSALTDVLVAAGYDFSAYPTIVDVGGGHGPLLAAILAATPGSHGRPVRPAAVVVAAAKPVRDHESATGYASRKGRSSTAFPAAATPTS